MKKSSDLFGHGLEVMSVHDLLSNFWTLPALNQISELGL